MELTRAAEEAIRNGEVKRRVSRAGVMQRITFRIVHRDVGGIKYVALATEKIVELSELVKIANDVDLPVESQNGRAFPQGKSALDFRL